MAGRTGIHESIEVKEAALIYLMYLGYGKRCPTNRDYLEKAATPIAEYVNALFHKEFDTTPEQVISLIRHIKKYKLSLDDFL